MNDCSEFLLIAYDEIKAELISENYLRESGTLSESASIEVDQNLIESENSVAEEHEYLSNGDRLVLKIFSSMIEQFTQSIKESSKESTEINQELALTYGNIDRLNEEIKKIKSEPQILREYKNTVELITLKTTFRHDKISTIHPEASCLLQIKKVISFLIFFILLNP